MFALLRDRRGVASIEYGILAVGIIAAVTIAIGIFSTDLQAAFSALGDQLKAAM
jgi:Flp pilus assembly pilin Flp